MISFFCSKTDRKINYEQFCDALKLFADKKYPGDPDGVGKLRRKLTEGKGPQAVGVTVSYEHNYFVPLA